MPTEHVNDIQIYYEIHGEGEPLVLICGLGTDISEWGDINFASAIVISGA
jgi:3-oxoadipate enol-lactonase